MTQPRCYQKENVGKLELKGEKDVIDGIFSVDLEMPGISKLTTTPVS
jgi:hypothetical protein